MWKTIRVIVTHFFTYIKQYEQERIYNKGDTVFHLAHGADSVHHHGDEKQGLSLIIAAGEHCYLDYPQLPGQNNRGWMPTTTLEQSYRLDPAYGRPEKETNHIIGVQGTVWGRTSPFPEPHSLPRLSACLRHCGSRLVTDERALLGKLPAQAGRPPSIHPQTLQL